MKEKSYFKKKQEFEDRFSKVLKKFPDVKEGEIKIEYFPDAPEYIIFSPFEGYFFRRYNPMLNIGKLFDIFSVEEQEAIMAHELGHYRRMRNKSFRKISWIVDTSTRIPSYRKAMLTKKNKHEVQRLLKWYILFEGHADNEAVKEGYSKQLFSALKKAYKQKRIPILAKRGLEDRIKNLEEILEDKEK